MIRFMEFINESLDRPYPLNIRKNTGTKYDWVSEFKTEVGEQYVVFAKNTIKPVYPVAPGEFDINVLSDINPHGGTWEIHFALKKGDKYVDGREGVGDAFRVFATIAEFSKQLVKEVEPDILMIMSKGEDKQRGRLYGRMLDRYAGKFGYKFLKIGKGTKNREVRIYKKK